MHPLQRIGNQQDEPGSYQEQQQNRKTLKKITTRKTTEIKKKWVIQHYTLTTKKSSNRAFKTPQKANKIFLKNEAKSIKKSQYKNYPEIPKPKFAKTYPLKHQARKKILLFLKIKQQLSNEVVINKQVIYLATRRG